MFADAKMNPFLERLQSIRKGKFKVYVGMSAGVGKTYRMLQEAHYLQQHGVKVTIGWVETHKRKETEALLVGLPVIPPHRVFYQGKSLEEMDLNAILQQQPEVVIVDELAHSNIPGSLHEKRYQDVLYLLDQGISVISAVNIQHIESLQTEVFKITGIEVKERIPDRILSRAEEVVNIDLTAEDLISRLKEGKIYGPDKIEQALQNFFRPANILQLRELALKQVASLVERKVESEIPTSHSFRLEKFMACINIEEKMAKNIIRKTARLANYYQSKWIVLYVETPKESPNRIPLNKQRHLIHNFNLATELGAELIRISDINVPDAIVRTALENNVTTLCVGKPILSLYALPGAVWRLYQLLIRLKNQSIDLVILS